MAEIPRYVVDTSVAVRWYLQDEPFREHALAVLDDSDRGRILLLTPDLIYAEVASALRNATRIVRQPRISNEEGRAALAAFLALDLRTIDIRNLSLRAYYLSGRFGCSLYDACYLALAEIAQCVVIHADNRLRNALGNRFPLELWIEEYQAH